jgi:glycosyltransferase involved in cell wall biosynthesis
MRILYVIDCGLNAGGAPRSTGILADEMAKSHEVYMLMPYTGETGNPEIHYRQVKRFKNSFPFLFTQPLQALLLILEVYKVVKEVKPDIIHAEMPRGARALGVLRKMGLVKAPLIYTEREFVTGLRKIYQLLYSILVAKPYDLIICLSKKSIPFWLHYREKGVVAIPNPGGREFDLYSDKDFEDAKTKLKGYNEDNLNVVFVGRYLNTKRWDLAEKIITEYNKKNLTGKVHFYVAVAYSSDDKDASGMVGRLEKQPNVTVYSNASVGIMSALYYACDIHLITSSIESFGRTAIEAMSRKCAVYSTDAGAISETIGDNDLILPAKSESFVEVIEKYESDRGQLDILKDRMYKRYQELYTTEANYLANLNEYKQLLNQR